MKNSRTYSLDILKFILSIIILIYHYNLYVFGKITFKGGYLCVELFFLITGYFLILSASNKDKINVLETVIKKIRNLYLPYVMMLVLMFMYYFLSSNYENIIVFL